MDTSIVEEIERLRQLTAPALRIQYFDVMREESRSSNKEVLFRRIAWRLQPRAEGDLSERARQRVAEISLTFELRKKLKNGWGPRRIIITAAAAPRGDSC